MDALKMWALYSTPYTLLGASRAMQCPPMAADVAAIEIRTLAGYLAEIERERIDNRADGGGWTKRKKASERKLWRKHIKKMNRYVRQTASPQ